MSLSPGGGPDWTLAVRWAGDAPPELVAVLSRKIRELAEEELAEVPLVYGVSVDVVRPR